MIHFCEKSLKATPKMDFLNAFLGGMSGIVFDDEEKTVRDLLSPEEPDHIYPPYYDRMKEIDVIAELKREGIKMGSAATHPDFYPSPSDSREELERKYELNRDAAAGEIAVDTVLPSRESDVAEYQSNAIVAKEYLQQKDQ